MVVNDKEKLIKKLWLYRSFLYRFTMFKTESKDKDVRLIVDALNIKRRYKRIYFIIDKACDQIDEYYKGKNLCKFKNNKCICHRKNNKDYINGCCRKCRYQSNKGCTTKNFACKMFNCSYVRERYKTLTYEDIPIIKVLTPLQRLSLKSDYFASIDEVALDLCWGPLYSIYTGILKLIKLILVK